MRLALILSAVLLAASVQAAEFTVDSTVDSVDASPGDGVCADDTGACTLRAAVMETNALAGANVIDVPAGNYATGGFIVISDDLTIRGAGAGATVIGAAVQEASDVLVGWCDECSLRIQDLTITGARRWGIFFTSAGDLRISGSTIENSGSGIAHHGSDFLGNAELGDGSLEVSGCTIENNDYGVYAVGRLDVVNSTLSGNRAAITNSFSRANVINSTVSGNSGTCERSCGGRGCRCLPVAPSTALGSCS